MSRSHKFLIVFLYVYALSFSVFKTFGLPDPWAVAHWLMDYRFGFIKRGLGGEIFGFFLEKTDFNILVVSAIILVMLYLTLLVIAVKETWKEYSFYKVLFYLIFFLSQYAVFSMHLIGYFDHLIILMTIISVYFIRNKMILLPAMLTTFCIMIHEISLFLMVPVCLFALLVNEIHNNKLVFNRTLFKKLGLYLLFPLIAVVSISFYQESYGNRNFQAIYDYLQSTGKIGKKVTRSVAAAYTESFSNYLKSELPYFLNRVFISKCTIKYGIPLLFMMYMAYRELQKTDIRLLIVLAAVSVSPLLLHAIAWDTFRIWAFPFIMLFLCFWILRGRCHVEDLSGNKLSWLEITFFLVAVMLVSLFPNILFHFQKENFSLPVRLIILVPIFAILVYLYKKAPAKTAEA